MSNIKKLMTVSQGADSQEPRAIDFDGESDFLSRSSDFAGNTDSKTFTFSCWFYNDGTGRELYNTNYNINNGFGPYFRVALHSSGNYLVLAAHNGSGQLLANFPTTKNLPVKTFVHILISGDTANSSNFHYYIQDVQTGLKPSVYNDGEIGFSKSTAGEKHLIGGVMDYPASVKWKGRLTDVYLDYVYRDLSIEANRRLFSVYDEDRGLVPVDPELLVGGEVVGAGSNGWLTKTTGGTVFNGTDNYLSRSSDLVGNTDSKAFTFSAWVYNGVSTSQFFYATGDFRFYVKIGNTGLVTIRGENAAGTLILLAFSSLAMTRDTLTHLLISVDLANTSSRFAFVNDSVDPAVNWGTYTNDNIDFTFASHTIAAYEEGVEKLQGRLAHVYLDHTYRDLSIEANRRLFITEDGLPAANQAALSPILYLPLDEAPLRSATYVNLGTGGDFDVNGALPMSDGAVGAGGNQEIDAGFKGLEFNGVDQYLSKTSDFTGNTDSKTFTFAFWYYRAAGSTTARYIYDNGDFRIQIFDTNKTFSVQMRNSSDAFVLNTSKTNFFSDNEIHEVIVSVDLSNTANRSVYLNDKEVQMTWTTYTNDLINFTNSNHTVGAHNTPNQYVYGDLAHVYLDYTYRDLSIESERRKFITADLKPVDQSIVATYNPILYLPMTDADTANVNLGTGGDMVKNGSAFRLSPYGLDPIFTACTNPDDPTENLGTGGAWTQNGVMVRSNRGPNQFNAVASEFDGTNDYLKNIGFSGTDSNEILLSMSFNWDGSGFPYIFQIGSGGNLGEVRFLSNSIRVTLVGPLTSSNTIYKWESAVGSVVAGKNYSLQLSFDLSDIGKHTAILNGIKDTTPPITYVNSNIKFYGQEVHVSANWASAPDYSGDIGELYFDTSYFDLSVDNPFYDAETNKPKYLGELGEIPTGSQPLIYLPIRADDAGNNLGSGADFTVNSGPLTGARGASEYWARSASPTDDNSDLTATGLGVGDLVANGFSCVFFAKAPDTSPSDEEILFHLGSSASEYFTINIDSFQQSLAFSSVNTSFDPLVPNAFNNTNWHCVFLNYSGNSTKILNVVFDGDESMHTLNVTNNAVVADVIGLMGSSSGKVTDSASNSFVDGNFGSFYMIEGNIDFSDEANRLLFVDALGNPVPLQKSIDEGLIPEGLIRMGFEDTDDLGFNSGTGGHFTINGTVTAGADVNG